MWCWRAGRAQPGVNALQQCPACNADFKFSEDGALKCATCAAGNFTSGGSNATRTTCSTCLAGTSCDGGHAAPKCTAGTFSRFGDGRCTACPRGRDSDSYASKCEAVMSVVYGWVVIHGRGWRV